MDKKNKDLIGSIQKAIKIIETFSDENVLQGISELSEKTGYTKATVHRIVKTLVYEGWMMQDKYSKRYGLGYGLCGYEKLVVINDNLIEIGKPIMKELRNEFNETVFLSVLEGDKARCIHKIESGHHIKLISVVGKLVQLYAGATSQSILAFCDEPFIDEYLDNEKLIKFTEKTVIDKKLIKERLKTIRKNRYAKSDSEVNIDTFTVSAPFFNKHDEVLGCLSISIPTYRYNKELEIRMIDRILESTQMLTNKIGKDNNLSS